MALLKKAENQMAYAKIGISGFQGSGKTHTAMLIALGIAQTIGENRIAFYDTETGSDWWVKRMPSGIELFQVKSRAFSDLCETVRECESSGINILIADSVTHSWRDLCDSYVRKTGRKRLEFQDWRVLKGTDEGWGIFADLFVNSKIHLIICGRAGFEYDYIFNDDGSKDLVKTGTKMKAESEFGFEPSLVLEMESVTPTKDEVSALEELQGSKKKRAAQAIRAKIGSKFIHRAHVLKDRSDKLNGESFDNPTFESFLPHFQELNLGGAHLGVDTSRNSDQMFEAGGDAAWRKKQTKKKIALEKIEGALTKLWPGSSASEKKMKRVAIEMVFATCSWTEVENLSLDDLELAANRLLRFADVMPVDGDDAKCRDVWQSVLLAEMPRLPVEEADVPY